MRVLVINAVLKRTAGLAQGIRELSSCLEPSSHQGAPSSDQPVRMGLGREEDK